MNFSKNLAGILYDSVGEWSIVAILAHLRACDDVWSYSIYAMLVQDNPLLAAIHPRQWIKVTPYARLDFGPSLQASTGVNTDD